MMRITNNPWRCDYLAVAVETVARSARRVPLSCSYAVVAGGRISSTHHHPIAWWQPGEEAERLRTAVTTAETARALSPEVLLEGMAAPQAFALIERLFREAAKSGLLVVTHDPSRRLDNLLRAIEDSLGTAPVPLLVLNTAVLELARHLGLRQRPDESYAAYRRRIEQEEGLLPDVVACYCEQEWGGEDLRPGDRLFPVFATHRIYERHRRDHLEGDQAVA